MHTHAIENAPFVATFFVHVEIAPVPGVQHVHLILEQVGNVVGFAARVAAVGVELDPHYCDVICRRFEAFTGQSAQLAETGEAFADAAAQRMIEAAEANGEAA